MSTGTKQPLAKAQSIAAEFIELLTNTCDRIEIAGSVRRNLPQVGDIEMLAIPAYAERNAGGGLFTEKRNTNLLLDQLDALVSRQVIVKHLFGVGCPKWGDKYRAFEFAGFKFDLFTADKDSWGAQFTIRTGPAEFSQRMVERLRARGCVNNESYVYRLNLWTCACGWSGDDPLWETGERSAGFNMVRAQQKMHAVCRKCAEVDTVRPLKIPVPEEADYFEVCGLAYMEPERRA